MEYGYTEIPIQLDIVLEALKRTIQIYPYSSFLNDEVTIEEIYAFFESELGACSYDFNSERYIIYYNDTKDNYGLERFTIAHELGHIFLKHHQKLNTNVLLRKGVSAKQYQEFEKEANCFARNFLSPYPLVFSITDITRKNKQTILDIMGAFRLSYKAAETRVSSLKLDSYRITQEHFNYFNKYNILYGDYCTVCLNAETTGSNFCKICGVQNNVFEKGVDRLYYEDGADMNDEMQVLQCPRCGNEEINDTAGHCKICGLKLYNYCIREEVWDSAEGCFRAQSHKNPSNARFCEVCGKETLFFKEGLLEPWEEAKQKIESSNNLSSEDDFPF
jgi:Zn-dependent peptidase ImmA (M78 family)